MRGLRLATVGGTVVCLSLSLASSALAGGVKLEPLPAQHEIQEAPFHQSLRVSKVEARYVVTNVVVVNGALPPGVELEGAAPAEAKGEPVNAVAIAGTPTSSGNYSAELEVTTQLASCAPSCPATSTQSDTQGFSYSVVSGDASKPGIAALGSASLGGGAHAPVSARLIAEVPAPYESVTLTASGLPEGVTAEQVGHELLISGFAVAATTSPATIVGVFTGAKATTRTVTLKLPVKIGGEATKMLIEPATAKLPRGESGVDYSLPVSVSGTWTEEAAIVVLAGTLPPGLSLVGEHVNRRGELIGETVELEGTPATAGTWSFTLGAHEEDCEPACSTIVSRAYSLTIEPNVPGKVHFLTEAATLTQGQQATLDFSRMHLTLSNTPNTVEHSILCTTQSLAGQLDTPASGSLVTFSFPESTFLGEGPEAQECTMQHGSPAKVDQFLGGRLTVSTHPIPTAQPPELAFQAPTVKSRLGLGPMEMKATGGKLLIGVSFVEEGITCMYEAGKLPGVYQPGELVAEVAGELSLAPKQSEECPAFMAVFGELSLTSNGEQLFDFS
ncbi:MAG TPA: hypothetical protein VH025_04090 [Solirubrobacteraceae bacterium]|jgi:hypothetical protein|nr:hypothetical protein [Solirubrobacteraceae bacterium]